MNKKKARIIRKEGEERWKAMNNKELAVFKLAKSIIRWETMGEKHEH